MIPRVTSKLLDRQTGVTKPSTAGLLCIIAPSEKGPTTLAASYTDLDEALAVYGDGPLVEDACREVQEAGNPFVLLRATASVAATYGTPVLTGAGTADVTAGPGLPFDDYSVLVTIINGGTLGATGITYKYSLDGGRNESAVFALGTSLVISIPRSGVQVTFETAETVLTGQTIAIPAFGPSLNSTNLTDALETLRTSTESWNEIIVHGPSDAAMLAVADAWLKARRDEGKPGEIFLNTRAHTSGETASTFRSAMATIFAAHSADQSKSIGIGYDYCEIDSLLTNIRKRVPVAVVAAARAAKVDIATDLASAAEDDLPSVYIANDDGSQKYHNESKHPGPDDDRFITLMQDSKMDPVKITNPRLFTSAGSDWVYLQHARVMNRAIEVAVAALKKKLSIPVRKHRIDANTAYIQEGELTQLESGVNSELKNALLTTPPRADSTGVKLSRTDNVSPNTGSKVTGQVKVDALSYIKGFDLTASFGVSL
jgi:hypothetical protein